MKEKIKNQKGITLIALIITIIVLLILAGVTIAQITGNENAMDKAVEAKEKQEEGAKQEEIELAKASSKLETAWDGTVAESFAGGTGTESDPYIIENGPQLSYLAAVVNGEKTPPTGATATFEGKNVSITKSINLGGREFTPIGVGGNDVNRIFEAGKIFEGTLIGNNKVITGLKISYNDLQPRYGVGLVGVLGEYGTVKNVILYEGEIKDREAVGGIVGASKGIIENCQNNVNVTSVVANVGGIVGKVEGGSIKNCINSGKITAGGNQVGGIVGFFGGSIIKDCSNKGDVSSPNVSAGGIVGIQATGSLENCSNSGSISGRNQIGGIVGLEQGEKILNCVNTGNVGTNNVAGRHGAGGIVGTTSSNECEISRVYNSGKVFISTSDNDNNFGGGVVGCVLKVESITYAYNKGEVINEKTKGTIGAIVGFNSVENAVTNCYYYLPQGSTLVGIGGEGANQTGTEGNSSYNYSSLNAFLKAFNV